MISKIKTKEEIERKAKRNQLILGAGLVLLLIASTAGFSLINANENQAGSQTSTGGSLEEYGITFTLQQSTWIAQISGQPFYFQHLPSELEDFPIEGTYSLVTYQQQPLYFVNSESASTAEILNNLHSYVLRYQDACLEGQICTNEELPKKTCADNVIIALPESTETKVYKEQNCVYIEGDQIKGADAFIYKTLGIL